MKEEYMLLEILNRFIHPMQEPHTVIPSEIQIDTLMEQAAKHAVLPIVYEVLIKNGVSKESLKRYKPLVLKDVSSQAQRTAYFLSLYEEMRIQGIAPIVLKGIVCRQLYQKPDYRISSDEDLWIEPSEYEKVKHFLEERGFTPDIKKEKESHEITFYQQRSKMKLELHISLFPEESTSYGKYNDLFKDSRKRAKWEIIEGQPLHILCETDHMLYLICHAAKHFLHSGFGVRQVCDMVLFAERYGASIDWDALEKGCEKVKIGLFARGIFQLGVTYLGFSKEKAGCPYEESLVKTEDLLLDILDSGVYGQSSAARIHSSNMTLEAASNEQKQRTGLKNTLFPSTSYMKNNYPYVEKYPFLLPAAWIMRILSYIRKTNRKEIAETLVTGKRRVELIRTYGLSGEKVVNTNAYLLAMKELIEEGKEVRIPVSGGSMAPFLIPKRDDVFVKKPEQKLKVGDIVLYQRQSGQYVLHRICAVHKEYYDIIGDAQTQIEKHVHASRIFGVVYKAARKGNIIGKRNFWWLFFEKIWIRMIPVRPAAVKIYTRLCSKLFHNT